MTDTLTGLAPSAPFVAGARPSPLLAEARALVRLATPIMLIGLVNMGMSITDAAMVSVMFGAEALAAVAVGSDLYSILFYLGAGILAGLAPFYTTVVVRGDPSGRPRLERIGQVTALLVAVVLVPAVWTAPDWLAHLGLDPALLEAGRGYTRAIALTLAPMLGVALYRTILTAAEQPRVFLKVTLAMLPLNAAANYLLMVGTGPLPELGPTGAGVSSLLVASASLVVLHCIARRHVQVDAGAEPGIDWRGLIAVLRVGLPIGIATVAEVGVFLAATIYAATLGAAAVAAHTLTLRLAGVAYAVPSALLQAAMVRAARAQSLDDRPGGRAVTAAALCLAAGCGALLFSLLSLAAEPLPRGFFDATAAGLGAAETAAVLLVLLAVMELAGTPGAAASGILRGRKDTRAPMLYTVAAHWLVGAPLGLYLCEVQDLGITGIWWGLTAGSALAAALMLARLLPNLH